MIFGELASSQIRRLDEKLVVLLPLGALEQHGPHLPLLTDAIIADALAERVEAELPDRTLRMPTLSFGYSPHHAGFPGTVTVEWDVYVRLVSQILTPLIELRFRRILLLNAHGGNDCPAKIALRELKTRYANVKNLWLVMLSEWEAMREAYHACAVETSLISYLRPYLVSATDVDTTTTQLNSDFYSFDPLSDKPDRVFLAYDFKDVSDTGVLGRAPRESSAEMGQRIFDGMVKETAAFVREFATWP